MIDIFDLEYWHKFNSNDEKVLEYVNFIDCILKCGVRQLDYFEKHHIVPKCLDESLIYDKNNIVILSGREHYIAHKMLTECFNGKFKSKMCFALHLMSHGEHRKFYNITEEEYENMRILQKDAVSKTLSGENHYAFGTTLSDEVKQKIRESNLGNKNPFYGKHHTDETKEILKNKNIGKKLSEEQKRKISKSLTGMFSGSLNPMYGKKHTKEWKESHSKAMTDRVWITKDGKRKFVPNSELEKYTNDGWVRGFKI